MKWLQQLKRWRYCPSSLKKIRRGHLYRFSSKGRSLETTWKLQMTAVTVFVGHQRYLLCRLSDTRNAACEWVAKEFCKIILCYICNFNNDLISQLCSSLLHDRTEVRAHFIRRVCMIKHCLKSVERPRFRDFCFLWDLENISATWPTCQNIASIFSPRFRFRLTRIFTFY